MASFFIILLHITFELNGAALFAASEQGGFLPCVFE
jgi:hypothetical protein